ncbi:helix-turn-helix transcriptional regulator [Candidatus Pacearchaeota archaeon]|nr:helix-turn-helix transcriptional regulator [Candidatus Pacearchaeota archaeon]
MQNNYDINQYLGRKLKSLRQDINYGIRSQEELACLMKTNQGKISRLERGEAWDADWIMKVCEIYKISPDELMRYDIRRGCFEIDD